MNLIDKKKNSIVVDFGQADTEACY